MAYPLGFQAIHSDYMSDSLPDFDLITDTLRSLESDNEAAESHGTLCGMLCGIGELNPMDWLNVTLAGFDLEDPARQARLQPLVELFEVTRAQFDSSSFDFHLLLPEDEAGLASRVEALGQWCQGFLAGLGFAGLQQLDNLPGELPEIVKDMNEIARAERYELAGDEEDESAYAELVEYVRMGVLLFREEFRRQFAGNAPDSPEQLH